MQSGRRLASLTVLAMSVLSANATPSFAQMPTNLGPTPMIGGVRVVCGGAITFVQPGLNDIAKAAPGQIILRPDLFDYPPVIQLFVYAHECGHQMVGANESAADCWAIKIGRNQGWLPPQFTPMLVAAFGNSQGDWTHAPGPARINNMAGCYNTP
jgi:hypothetical protein